MNNIISKTISYFTENPVYFIGGLVLTLLLQRAIQYCLGGHPRAKASASTNNNSIKWPQNPNDSSTNPSSARKMITGNIEKSTSSLILNNTDEVEKLLQSSPSVLPKIERIEYSNYLNKNIDQLNTLLRSLPNLKSLELSISSWDESFTGLLDFSQCLELEHFKINTAINIFGPPIIINNGHGLTRPPLTLDFSMCKLKSFFAYSAISFLKFSELESLSVSNFRADQQLSGITNLKTVFIKDGLPSNLKLPSSIISFKTERINSGSSLIDLSDCKDIKSLHLNFASDNEEVTIILPKECPPKLTDLAFRNVKNSIVKATLEAWQKEIEIRKTKRTTIKESLTQPACIFLIALKQNKT